MSDEQDKLKLSLEPPKLFGRKKKPAEASPAPKDASERPEPEAAPVSAEVPEAAELPEVAEAGSDSEPAADAQATPEVEPDTESDEEASADEASADAEPTVVLPDVDTAPASQPDPESESVSESVPEPVAARTSAAAPKAGYGVVPPAEPTTDTSIDTSPDTSADTSADDSAGGTAEQPSERRASVRATAAAAAARASKAALAARAAMASPDADELPDADDAEAPLLSVYRAAALTGLVVGAALVTLTWLALRGCEAVRGQTSCGGGPGFLLLLATFAVCVYLGMALLRAFQIPDPGSSSFLAVGLVAVVALLFLIDALDHWSMLIVIPVLTLGAFLASVWVTKTFVEPADT